MRTLFEKLLIAFEGHSVKGIREVLRAGFDVTQAVDGKLPIEYLIEMYYRSDAFPECLQLMIDSGASLPDSKLAAVLLNDAERLAREIQADPSLLAHRSSMICTFTPLIGASLLHVAAEYGHMACAATLIEMGADVNARAAFDDEGLNGHTPMFHTVNSNANRSAPLMKLLLEAGADTGIRLAGIRWGKGFEWETVCFDVTPVSYAQLGLLRQMQRTEADCYSNIAEILKAAGRAMPRMTNVPNKYLAS